MMNELFGLKGISCIEVAPKGNRAKKMVEVYLPYSKSVRARCLIINALCADGASDGVLGAACSSDVFGEINSDDECDDIRFLSRALNSISVYKRGISSDEAMGNEEFLNVEVGESGTALRFLTAVCAISKGNYYIHGSERICSRPIATLVDALRSLGARIDYVNDDNFAPLKVHGLDLRGGAVDISPNTSSQFVSALMLIAPAMSEGLRISLHGDVASEAYIRLTADVMRKSGIELKYLSNTILIGKGDYHTKRDLWFDADWSAASFWFAVVAMMGANGANGAEDRKILLRGLKIDSPQPDAAIVDIFSGLGVLAEQVDDGVVISFQPSHKEKFIKLNFANNPDVVLPFVVAAVATGVHFEIDGLSTLQHKESDRLHAIEAELFSCGYDICIVNDCGVAWHGEAHEVDVVPTLDTYNDHRMAMSLALMGIYRRVRIKEPWVVSKSYPRFWNEISEIINTSFI